MWMMYMTMTVVMMTTTIMMIMMTMMRRCYGDDGMADDMTMTVMMMMVMMVVVMMSAAICYPGQRSPLCGFQPDPTARAMWAAKRSNPDVAGGQPTGKMRLPLLC